MISVLLNKDPRSVRQLHNPERKQRISGVQALLANKLGIREKLLKAWVTRGWYMLANVQSPGRG